LAGGTKEKVDEGGEDGADESIQWFEFGEVGV
jgi:hypothetical protein